MAKIFVAIPDGRIVSCEEKIDMKVLQQYKLSEHPLQIGYAHDLQKNGKTIKSFVPKLIWKPEILISN